MKKTIEGELKSEYGLQRAKPVGKKMANDLYFHKSYVDKVIEPHKLGMFTTHLPDNFKYDIVKYNEKDKTISFISCPDFDTHEEPIVGDSITVDLSSKFPKVYQTKASDNNPFVYHHKWMFVDNSYSKFNTLNSMARSLQWKKLMKRNDEKISSTIGRSKVWNEWCKNNNLKNLYTKDCYDIFQQDNYDGMTTSADTSVKQIPKIITFLNKYHNSDLSGKTVFDIGCGKYPEMTKEKVENINGRYLFADPYNQPKDVNLENISKARDGQSDFVTLCNVLNTIKLPDYESAAIDLLEQCKNSLSDDGQLVISIYEGELTKAEKLKKEQVEAEGRTFELEGKYTKQGNSYQNRKKTETYLPLIQKVFGEKCQIIRKSNILVLTQNPKIDLTAIYGGKEMQKHPNQQKSKVKIS